MNKFTGERADAYGQYYTVGPMTPPSSPIGEHYLSIGLDTFQAVVDSTPVVRERSKTPDLADPVRLNDGGIEVSFQGARILYYGEHAGAAVLGTYRAHYPNCGTHESEVLAHFEPSQKRTWWQRSRTPENMRVTFYSQERQAGIPEPHKNEFQDK